MKQTIRLTESQLRNMIQETIQEALNGKFGGTKRGQFMLGRTAAKNYSKNPDVTDDALSRRPKPWSVDDEFSKGWESQRDIENGKDGATRKMRFDYDVAEIEDMKEAGNKFIEFIENDNVIMSTIVDYFTGNQTGTPESGFQFALGEFEDEVLGYDCSPKMRQTLERAFNEWWYYAEDQLIPQD